MRMSDLGQKQRLHASAQGLKIESKTGRLDRNVCNAIRVLIVDKSWE